MKRKFNSYEEMLDFYGIKHLSTKEKPLKESRDPVLKDFIGSRPISLDDIFEFMREHHISQIQDIFGHYVVFYKKDMKNANV